MRLSHILAIGMPPYFEWVIIFLVLGMFISIPLIVLIIIRRQNKKASNIKKFNTRKDL